MKRVVVKLPPVRRLLEQRDSLLAQLRALSERQESEASAAKLELNRLSEELTIARSRAVPEFSKVVYSHWGEDSVLQFIFENVNDGTYLDIGCYHPSLYSNTVLLHGRGWSGVNVDPNPFMIEQFNQFRPRDRNINKAVGKARGEIQYFNFHDWATSNTASPDFARLIAANHDLQVPKATTVPMVTLADLMEEHFAQRAPDFMNIDVEDLDADALKSGNWMRWRPNVVAIEDINFIIERREESEIYRFLTEQGYTMFSRCIYTNFFIENAYSAARGLFR